MCLYTFWSCLKLKLEVKRDNVLQHNLFLWGFQLPSAILGALRKGEAWQDLPPLHRNPWGRLSCTRDSPFSSRPAAGILRGWPKATRDHLAGACGPPPPRAGGHLVLGQRSAEAAGHGRCFGPLGLGAVSSGRGLCPPCPGWCVRVTQFMSAVTEITESIKVSPLPWVASVDRQPCCRSAVRKRHSNSVESLQKC